MTLDGELVKHRYIRTRPANTWMIKCIYGLRAMLANFKARVDIGAIFREETTISST